MKSFLRVSSLNTEWGGKGDFKFEGEIFASIRTFLFCLMQNLFIACRISLWKYMPQEIWVSKGMFFSNPCSVLFKSSKMTWLVDFEGTIGVGLSVFPGGDSMPTEWSSCESLQTEDTQPASALPRSAFLLAWETHGQLQGLDLVSGVTVLMVVVVCCLHVSALEILHYVIFLAF